MTIICQAGKKPCGMRFDTLTDWLEHYQKTHRHNKELPDFLQKLLDSIEHNA